MSVGSACGGIYNRSFLTLNNLIFKSEWEYLSEGFEFNYRVFSNHLKQEIPEIMEMAELRCGDNNGSNFISKYNNGKLSIGGDVQDMQSLYIRNKSSLLKKGIKMFLKIINNMLLTYRV